MSQILETLKRLHPEKEWRIERSGFNWHYVTSDGWSGEFRSCLVSTHPDDSDGHATDRFFIYKPGGDTESVRVLDRGTIYAI